MTVRSTIEVPGAVRRGLVAYAELLGRKSPTRHSRLLDPDSGYNN
ncbi:DUF2274 domain-containing protein [Mesorhizobium sp. M1348]